MTFAPVMILLLILAMAAHSEDTSTRVLLRPPDNMPATRIGDKDYLKGEVYLSKTADPAMLKPLGFLKVEFFASASRYNRYKALWPRTMILDSLPPEIVGINYDYTPPEDNIYVFSGGKGPTVKFVGTSVITSFTKYAQAFPAQPDTMILGMAYVKGMIYLSSLDDTSQLRGLGFTALWEMYPMLNSLNDPRVETYLAHPERYRPETGWPAVYGYNTCWPMDLDPSKLPQTVLNLISDRVAADAEKIPGHLPTTGFSRIRRQ